MQFLLVVILWFLLLALAWPLALLVILLLPAIWLIALPLRLVGVCIGAAFALIKALLFLPARILGFRG